MIERGGKAEIVKAGSDAQFKAAFLSAFLTADLLYLTSFASKAALAEYGLALFFAVPLVLGVLNGVLIGWKHERPYKDALVSAMISLVIGLALSLIFAVEGVICILMASPLLIGTALLGAWFGHLISANRWAFKRRRSLLSCLLVIAPLFIVADQSAPRNQHVRTVESSAIVSASPSAIWPLLFQLDDMAEPSDWLLRSGIAHPVSVRSKGSDRWCVLSTGVMPERITRQIPNRLLHFEVLQTPPSMKELNPFGKLSPKHLRDYYTSVAGEFELVQLPNGSTRIIGRSWYSHEFAPSWYWSLWTDSIVHRIHEQVFEEIARRLQRGNRSAPTTVQKLQP